MSQSKYPTLKIKTKNPDGPPTGANVLVELDGVPLRTANFVKIECHARRVHRITLELYSHVEVDVIGDITTKVIPLTAKNK